jgi:hypothetical protein
MQAEVRQINEALGWWDSDVLFLEAMALLHTEVAESSDAWRRWGTDDATAGPFDVNGHDMVPVNPKPEGVGSEFADILIRLLDDDERYGIGLAERLGSSKGAFLINESFLANMCTLHGFIAKACWLWEMGDTEFGEVGWEDYLTRVLSFLLQLCEFYGIDLMAEYTRKAAFNRTRPYRHGNKRV